MISFPYRAAQVSCLVQFYSMDATDPNSQVAAQIQDVVEKLKAQFEQMSNQIMTKLDDMGSRMELLEKSLDDMIDKEESLYFA